MNVAQRKVLYVIASLQGGAAEHLLYLIEYFSSRSYRIFLAAPDDCPVTAEKLCAFPISWIKVALDRASYFSRAARASLADLLVSEHMELIHTHGIRGGYHGRLALKRARGRGCRARSVYTVHGFHPAYYESAIRRWAALWMERRLYEQATDRVIFVSRSDQQLFERLLQLPAADIAMRSTVIYNGVRFPLSDRLAWRLQARRSLGINGDSFVIGTLSRLSRQKAVHLILAAVAQLKEQIPGLHCVLAGDGPCRASLEALTERLGIAHQVHFLGYRKDVETIYAALDCFVLSSLWEGLPLVLLEAAGRGLPVIASHVGGSDEIMEPDKSALFFEPNNATSLARQIYRVYREPALAQQLADHARRTIPERFSLQKMLEKTEAVYENVLAGG